MARDSNQTRPWDMGSAWGDFTSTAQLPCVAGATLQSDQLMVGDIASVAGELYTCTAIALGIATWKKVARDGATINDLTMGTGALTVGTGGIVPITAPTGVANWQPIAATSGTDTTPADGTQFVTSIWLPCSMTITSISYLIGSVGGTDKVYVVLYDSAGAVLRNSSLTDGGATVGTLATIQAVALTSTYAAKGPGRFFIGVSMNGNTARLRTVPAHCQAGLFGGQVSQAHGTVAAITAPSTFTADKAPIVFVS